MQVTNKSFIFFTMEENWNSSYRRKFLEEPVFSTGIFLSMENFLPWRKQALLETSSANEGPWASQTCSSFSCSFFMYTFIQVTNKCFIFFTMEENWNSSYGRKFLEEPVFSKGNFLPQEERKEKTGSSRNFFCE